MNIPELEIEPEPQEQEAQELDQQQQAPAYVELDPATHAFIREIQVSDYQALSREGPDVHGNCLLRNYIPGEAAPMSDPPGASHTFLAMYNEFSYVRVFIANGGITGLILSDILDTNQPGMSQLRAENMASFKPYDYVKFAQASINQHMIASSKTNIVSLDEARRLKGQGNNNDFKRGPKH